MNKRKKKRDTIQPPKHDSRNHMNIDRRYEKKLQKTDKISLIYRRNMIGRN